METLLIFQERTFELEKRKKKKERKERKKLTFLKRFLYCISGNGTF